MKKLQKLSQKHWEIIKLRSRNVQPRDIALILNIKLNTVYQIVSDPLVRAEIQKEKDAIAEEIEALVNEYGALGALKTLYNAQIDKTVTRVQIDAADKLLQFSKLNVQKIDANLKSTTVNIIDNIPHVNCIEGHAVDVSKALGDVEKLLLDEGMLDNNMLDNSILNNSDDIGDDYIVE